MKLHGLYVTRLLHPSQKAAVPRTQQKENPVSPETKKRTRTLHPDTKSVRSYGGRGFHYKNDIDFYGTNAGMNKD